jgi:hypothetical protein
MRVAADSCNHNGSRKRSCAADFASVRRPIALTLNQHNRQQLRGQTMASEIARLKAAATNQRRKMAETEALLVRKSVIVITGAATAFAETKGMPLSVAGVPIKLGIATVGALAEAMTRDPSMRRILGAVAECELAIYSYGATKTRAFISGDEL